MADSKLSELTAATSVAAADTFYLVQSSTSKGVTAANLFADVATPVSFSDKVSIADADTCLLYTSPSPRDVEESRMPSSA